jgi:transglutaminase-like putative cysteine protease
VTHIPFSKVLTQLASKITGDLTQPYDKALAIWNYIGENIPWTSALEYSTMASISSYCVLNGRGDCGMKAMLFITLCRISGIPAKWQSGWYMYDVERNLHDWTEIYFEGIGWIPVDPDFNRRKTGDVSKDQFFFGGRDKYRLVVNEDFGGNFYPAKIYPRSETVDFQRGEVEWKGGNLYFNEWGYSLRQRITPVK